MLITCPNCRTRYQLQPAQLGQGRNVSCSNCSNVWFADPKDAEPDPPPPPPAQAAPPPMQAAAPAYPPQGYPPQGYAPQPGYAAAPPPGYAPPPPQMAAPPPEMAAPPPPVDAAPPPEPAPEPDPMPEPEPEAADDDDIAALTTDIDSMFEDEDDDIEPFESLISSDDDGDDLEDIESPDQMEDPDEIPDVFTADEQEPDDDVPQKSPIGKIIGLIFVLLIVGTIAAAFFLKDMVVKYVPALDQVYEMIGFTQVGEGLQIQKLEFARELEAGLEVLVVRGRVENVSDEVKPVPILRAVLIDAEGRRGPTYRSGADQNPDQGRRKDILQDPD